MKMRIVYSIVILSVNFLINPFLATSQSGHEALSNYIYQSLKTDSIKVNSRNTVSFFISGDHKIFSDYKRENQIKRKSIYSIIGWPLDASIDNNDYPLICDETQYVHSCGLGSIFNTECTYTCDIFEFE